MSRVVSCAGYELHVCVRCGKNAHENEMCNTSILEMERNSDYYDRFYAEYAV